jgi:hypothetical protein
MASAFHTAVTNLPEPQQWSVMERINFRNACHFFTACRKDRPKESYAIDFSGDGVYDFVPSLRYRCVLNGNQLSRYDWSVALNHVEAIIMKNVNGQRTIANIIEKISTTEVHGSLQHAELKAVCKALFQRLWQLDFLAMGLKNPNE